MRIPLLLILVLSLCPRAGAAQDEIVFTQSVEKLDDTGRPLPAHRIRPQDRDLSVLSFDLGSGRELQIRTDLPPDRRAGLPAVVARIRRCYAHVEAATGRSVPGGVLLYLPAYHSPPETYDFEAVLPDQQRWCQVRLALLDLDDPRCGSVDDPALSDLLLDTLPHELGHVLVATTPTFRLDLSDGSGRGTRWFEEGICEVLAKSFSAAEDSTSHARLLADRNVAVVLEREGLRSSLLSWSQLHRQMPDLESDLYGAAYLVVKRWTDAVSLSRLLEDLARAGGRRDGADLLARMQRDLGTDVASAFDAAATLGRDLAR